MKTLWRRRLCIALRACVLAVLVQLVCPSVAWPCVCAQPAGPPCSLEVADVVFTGTVIVVSEDPTADDGEGLRRFQFAVSDAFAGVSGPRVEVSSEMSSCGVDFAPGVPYLVAATRSSDGTIHVDACSNSSPAAGALDEIEMLRALRSGTKPSRLFGRVVEFRKPGPDSRPTDPDLYQLLSNVPVIVAGGDLFRETRTDADGRFAFDDLPRGRYRVAVQVPAPKRVLDYSPGFHQTDSDPALASVEGCPVRVHFTVSEWEALIGHLPPLVHLQSCQNRVEPPSIASTTPATIRFENDRSDAVRLYSLDFSGRRVLYQTIARGQAALQETYISHRWVLTTEDDRCLAVVDAASRVSVAQIR